MDDYVDITSTDFWKNLEKTVCKSEQKKFNKQFKKIKKQLKKDAKDFQPWDYDYLVRFIEHSLEAMYLFLGNKHLVMQNTEWVDENDKNNSWKVHTAKLKEAYNLIKNRNEEDNTDYQSLKKAFKIMAEYITSWWD